MIIQEKMRVLYVINAFSWGGAEKLVFDLSRRMAKETEKVFVVALYRTNDQTEKDMIATLESEGISTHIIGKRAGRDRISGIKRLFEFVKPNNIDIIHGHCSVPMLFSKVVGLLLHIPVICTIHSTKGYSKLNEKCTSWMVAKYVSIGSAAEEYMRNDLNIKKYKIERIYNAIDTDAFCIREKNINFWKQYGGSEDELVVLNVARVHIAKNQMCLFRAIHKCVERGQKIHAYVLGAYDENDQLFQNLNKFVIDNGLSNSITFLGMHRNVSDFLTNSDCFVMTSSYEGLSVAFLEAVISGKPVITTKLGFVEELNEIAECSISIEQDDSDALADLLYEKSFRVPKAGTISKFKEVFALDTFVKKHHEVYDALKR